MSLDPENLAKADPVAKVVLAKRASRFLNSDNRPDEELATVENVARALAQDICLEVRETLAFELRYCSRLPYDLAARIATDVESVSGPFVEVTTAFTDSQWASLIPHLEEHALMRIAKRDDLGDHAIYALVSSAPIRPATVAVENAAIRFSERSCNRTVDRFSDHQSVIDALGQRSDLPLGVVERIVNMVSEECRKLLMNKYAISSAQAATMTQQTREHMLWKKISKAGPAQVHGYVIDLRAEGRLDEELVMKMAEMGSFQFLGSALAVEASVTLGDVRRIFESGDLRRMLELVHAAGFSQEAAQRIYRYLKRNDLKFFRSGEAKAVIH